MGFEKLRVINSVLNNKEWKEEIPELFRYWKWLTKLGLLDVITAKWNSFFKFWTVDKKIYNVKVSYNVDDKYYEFEIIELNKKRKVATKWDLEKALAKELNTLQFVWKDLNTTFWKYPQLNVNFLENWNTKSIENVKIDKVMKKEESPSLKDLEYDKIIKMIISEMYDLNSKQIWFMKSINPNILSQIFWWSMKDETIISEYKNKIREIENQLINWITWNGNSLLKDFKVLFDTLMKEWYIEVEEIIWTLNYKKLKDFQNIKQEFVSIYNSWKKKEKEIKISEWYEKFDIEKIKNLIRNVKWTFFVKHEYKSNPLQSPYKTWLHNISEENKEKEVFEVRIDIKSESETKSVIEWTITYYDGRVKVDYFINKITLKTSWTWPAVYETKMDLRKMSNNDYQKVVEDNINKTINNLDNFLFSYHNVNTDYWMKIL